MQEGRTFTLPSEDCEEKCEGRAKWHSLQASPVGKLGSAEMGNRERDRDRESGKVVEVKEFAEGKYEAGIRIVCASPAICRICLQSSFEELICPCFCKGSQMYVHQSCLESWLLTLFARNKEFMVCEVCKARYDIGFQYKFQCECMKYYLFPFGCLVLFIFAVMGVTIYWTQTHSVEDPISVAMIGFIGVMVLAIIYIGLYLLKYDCIKKSLIGLNPKNNEDTTFNQNSVRMNLSDI